MRKGHLDWTANNSLDPAVLYAEITRFEGKSMLESGIVANTKKDGILYVAKKVTPSFNIDFGECVELEAKPVFVRGRVIIRKNQPVILILDFKDVKGTFNIIVTDKKRMKNQPSLKTSTTPIITATYYAKYSYNYNTQIKQTKMQEEDKNADCKVYGEGRPFDSQNDCYQQEQEVSS